MMSANENAWPMQAVNAVSVWLTRGNIEVIPVDGDQVRVDSQNWSGLASAATLEQAAGWLMVHEWDDHQPPIDLTLSLPREKAWVLELSTGHGNVHAEGVKARFLVAVGHGDIEMTGCQGVFVVKAGSGSVDLEGCSEQDVPERPADPQLQPDFQAPAGAAAGPKIPEPRDWFDWGPVEWKDWGLQIGDQARVWARQFGHFWNQFEWQWPKSGVNLRTGKGDIHLSGIEARSCRVRASSGDLQFEGGAVTNLSASTSRGDLAVLSVYPGGAWELQSTHGDLRLGLPADAQARLDAATRQGDVRSEIALVRVARPGPESRHGGRMVGSLGPSEGARATIGLQTLRGDIDIRLWPPSRQPAPPPSAAAAEQNREPEPAATGPEPAGPTAAGIVDLARQPVADPAPAPASGAAAPTAAEPAQAVPAAPADPAMTILQALSEGKISVDEAERLLKALPQGSTEAQPAADKARRAGFLRILGG